MTNYAWAQRYVGKPWIDKGRDFNGFDCWGLVYLALKTELGIDVPTYGEISANELRLVTETIGSASNADPWIPVERQHLQPFDVPLLRGRPLHVGIMATENLMLHVDHKTDAVIVGLGHATVASRIIGFRRHKALIKHAA